MIWDNNCLEFAIDNAAEFDVTAFLRDDLKTGLAKSLYNFASGIKFRHNRFRVRGGRPRGWLVLWEEEFSRFQSIV